MSSVSPQWAICTRARSTPSSLKISTCRGPVATAGIECAMIGAPVCRLARATARWIFSTFSVTPAASAAHFRNAALMSVPWMPRSMSSTKWSAITSMSRFCEVVGEMVVAVDARARDDAHARLLGYALHEAHVAPAEHGGGIDDRLHAPVLGGPDGHQRRVELELLVIAPRPLGGHGLVAEADVLVHEHQAQLLRLHRSLDGLYARHVPLPRFAQRSGSPQSVCSRSCALQDLAARVARQRLCAQGHVLGDLEVRQMLAAVADHGCHVELVPGARHEHRADLLAHHRRPAPRRPPPRRRRGACERVFDLDRVHVLTAAVDHVLLAVDDVQQAIGVDPRDVAGVQPAVHERLGGRLGLVPVALHDVRAAHQQLADAGVRIGVIRGPGRRRASRTRPSRRARRPPRGAGRT